ncbi:hypothetical protein BKA70DRAFT_1256974 [Coprinopsis sp. MPI-PUGE-AT-0042]|nr:hypothetical protein BKA70DRAFT_1256974 [Coprinopsis sp. MPI-PUGE-AT-0042]
MANPNPQGLPLEDTPEAEEHILCVGQGTKNKDLEASGVIFPIVNQLAPELLCSIFLYCTPTIEETNDISHDTRISILHTCQRWRNAALYYPRLWSFIMDTKPSWMVFMIHRSKPVPISLHLSRESISEEVEGLVHETLSQSPRLVSLTITTSSVEHMAKRASYLAGHALNLHTLTLKSETGISPLPDEFLSAGAPQLRKLALRRCRLPSNLELLKRLEVFRWTGRGREVLYKSTSEMVSALAKMSNLVELHVSMFLSRMDTVNFPHEISFPKLQSMKVLRFFGLEHCSGLLKHFAIPQSASLEIVCLKATSPTIHLPRRIPSASHSDIQPLCEELYTVTVLKFKRNQFHVTASFQHGEANPDSSTRATSSLTIAVKYFEEPIGHTLLERLPLHSARIVNLCLQGSHDYDDVGALFRPFPLAEYITVNRYSAVSLLRYLREDSSFDLVDPVSKPLGRLPYLKRITFDGVALTAGSRGVSRSSSRPVPVNIFALLELLCDRAKLGACAVPKVALRNLSSGLTDKMVEALQAAGVTWEAEEGKEDTFV